MPKENGILCDACIEEGRISDAYTYLVEGGIASVRANLCIEHLSMVYQDHPKWIVKRPEEHASPAS